VSEGYVFDRESAARLADVADYICERWQEPDAGIWEVRSRQRAFTHSKMMCAIGLERACRLAELGSLPAEALSRWLETAALIREFVERSCWSVQHGAYVRSPGSSELDASLLHAAILGYGEADGHRLESTVDAVRRELGRGPLLYRYRGEDGLGGEEGAFLACSFWLVDVLARLGRLDDAAALMEELLGLANDVGLYAEQIDPATGGFLGNMQQALVHLALIDAAVSLMAAQR
jgi:GH15 family glucan-1,4-alpha-glucosidase